MEVIGEGGGERLGISWNREKGEASRKDGRGTGQNPVSKHGRRESNWEGIWFGIEEGKWFVRKGKGEENEWGKICLDRKEAKWCFSWRS